MKQIFTIFALLISLSIAAQPTIEWQKCFGGSQQDFAQSIQQTSDGGYIIAGTTQSIDGDITANNGNFDYWIVKIDAIGNIQWQKSYGGTNGDGANSIEQTFDGGYIVFGSSNSADGDVTGNHGGSDYWILKLNNNGTIQWKKALGGSGSDEAYAIQQTTDAGYIVLGRSTSNDGDVTGHHGNEDFWAVKLDNNGTIQWQKSLGGFMPDWAYDIKQTTDGGYILAGHTASTDGDVTGNHGSVDEWVAKVDSTGNLVWQKCFGGTISETATSIIQTTDGGYMVAGYTVSSDGDVTFNHGISDFWIIKMDTIGNMLWQKCFGGSSGEAAYAIKQTTDGGYIVAGYTESTNGDVITGFNGLENYWILKIDSIGTVQWQKSMGGTNQDIATSIEQTTDGGYIVAGRSSSMNGDITNPHGNAEFWIVKLSPDSLLTVGNQFQNNEKLFSIYPNPVNEILNINAKFNLQNVHLQLLDAIGNEVAVEQVKNKSDHFQISTLNLCSGIYFLKATDDKGKVKLEKFVKQ